MKEPVWVLEKTVIAIHSEQITEHGGASGIRERGLLQSALAASQNLWHCRRHSSLCQIAASYAYKLCKNHPFIDGNKRTAYVVSQLFLNLNGLTITASDENRVYVFLGLANGEITEQNFAKWLEKNTGPIEDSE